jgi:excisionase family DNA binding protein
MTETTLTITIPGLRDLLAETVEAAVTKSLANVRLEVASAPPTTESPLPSSPRTGIELKPTDRTKAGDLRIALLTGKLPRDAGLLIGVKTVGKLLNVSSRTVSRLVDEKAMPASVRLGSMVRWRLAEIIEWIEAGCPSPGAWTYTQHGSPSRKGR